jgi:hypothetical protein
LLIQLKESQQLCTNPLAEQTSFKQGYRREIDKCKIMHTAGFCTVFIEKLNGSASKLKIIELFKIILRKIADNYFFKRNASF